jgi:hypothetical protein
MNAWISTIIVSVLIVDRHFSLLEIKQQYPILTREKKQIRLCIALGA